MLAVHEDVLLETDRRLFLCRITLIGFEPAALSSHNSGAHCPYESFNHHAPVPLSDATCPVEIPEFAMLAFWTRSLRIVRSCCWADQTVRITPAMRMHTAMICHHWISCFIASYLERFRSIGVCLCEISLQSFTLSCHPPHAFWHHHLEPCSFARFASLFDSDVGD